MGRTASPPLKDAYKIVEQKARAYIAKNKYVSVLIFTKYSSETDLLKRVFGGKSSKHGTGYYWMLNKKPDVKEFLALLRVANITTKYGIEKILRKEYFE